MDINEKNLSSVLKKELDNILGFWIKYGIDKTNGGFFGEVGIAGTPVIDSPKGVVLNTRILWTFSAAYNYSKKKEYLQIAGRAFEYIRDYFWDSSFGGLYWSVSSTGKVIDDHKQIYAQGFGVYSFSEYFRASGKIESLYFAKRLFSLIEEHSFDPQYGGYIEALAHDWKPMEDMRLSPKDANEPKSMNTHLHIIEPYANLYKVWPNNELAQKITALIRVFLDHIINKESGHLKLFFEMNWKQKCSMVSYGHDIECTWLLCEAAALLNNPEIQKEVDAVAIKITDAVISDGMANDGSLFYEKNLTNNHLDEDRHWWVQAEAMVGFLNTWQITGNIQYKDKMIETWNYINNHIIDKNIGEWFLRIDKFGNHQPGDPKIGFWKCPYHNTRALIEIINRLATNIN